MNNLTGFLTKRHDLHLDTAKKYIKDFRAKFLPDNKEGFPYSEAFNKSAIMKLLNHDDCTGLRIFSGLKTEGHKQEVVFILMGIDKNGKNIESTTASLKTTANLEGINSNDDSAVQEQGQRDPPFDDGENL